MARTIFLILLLSGILAGCATPTPDPALIDQTVKETIAAVPTQAAYPTYTTNPTYTPYPTHTANPTYTPYPTHTDVPTQAPIVLIATSTSTPKQTAAPAVSLEPIILTGTTDAVVDLHKWPEPALAHITYAGDGHFAVWSYGANNEKYDLLVNTIGLYEGTVPIDFLEDEQTRRFEVTSSGPWEITVYPLAYIRREVIPGTITGSGDDVIYLDGENPDLLIVDGTHAKDNFVIWAYGSGQDLLVNEIAPYSGTVLLGVDTLILEINEGGGEWSLEVTTN